MALSAPSVPSRPIPASSPPAVIPRQHLRPCFRRTSCIARNGRALVRGPLHGGGALSRVLSCPGPTIGVGRPGVLSSFSACGGFAHRCSPGRRILRSGVPRSFSAGGSSLRSPRTIAGSSPGRRLQLPGGFRARRRTGALPGEEVPAQRLPEDSAERVSSSSPGGPGSEEDLGPFLGLASADRASAPDNGQPPASGRNEEGQQTENLRQAEMDFFMFTGYLAQYMLLLTASGAALETFAELAGGGRGRGSVLWFCWAAGVVIGCMVGAKRVLEGYARCGPRNVVVTGSTRGLGKALAREFLLSGDNVVVTSRSEEAVVAVVQELRASLATLGKAVPQGSLWVQTPSPASVGGEEADGDVGVEGLNRLRGRRRMFLCGLGSAEEEEEAEAESCSTQMVVGVACDVQSPEDVHTLARIAQRELGTVNIWVNNAGTNIGAKPFMEASASEVKQVVGTNLVGSMLCTLEAFRLLKAQPRGGHIFNMEGAGSEGGGTPRYAIYGSTKSALRQFHSSLLQECRGSRVGIHTASPGMVLTDLLLSGSTLQNKQAFNIVCEQPETVAHALVPRMRSVRGTGKAVNYLTPPRIILALITAWLRKGRWFDEEGRAVYAAEADRLLALAQGKQQQSPLTAVLEALPSSAWLSLLTSSAIGVYLLFTSIENSLG